MIQQQMKNKYMSENFETELGGEAEVRANIQGIPNLENWAEVALAFGLTPEQAKSADLVGSAFANALPVKAEQPLNEWLFCFCMHAIVSQSTSVYA